MSHFHPFYVSTTHLTQNIETAVTEVPYTISPFIVCCMWDTFSGFLVSGSDVNLLFSKCCWWRFVCDI